jgi:acid stress-induced BolA-like protein IbaG/YrbA
VREAVAVTIGCSSSPPFSPVRRGWLVIGSSMQLLGDLIAARMHALSIKAMTPEEAASPASVAI